MDVKKEETCTFPGISLLYADQEGVIVKMDIIVPISYQSVPTIENVVDVFKSKVDSLIESVISFIETEVENKFSIKTEFSTEEEVKDFDICDKEEQTPKYFSDADSGGLDCGGKDIKGSEIEKQLINVIRIKKKKGSEKENQASNVIRIKKNTKKWQPPKEICPDCGKFYGQEYLKKIHYYKCNNLPIPNFVPEEEGAFPCPECGKVFSKNTYLYIHTKNVHHERTFMCHLCDHRSKSKESLKKHMEIHDKRSWPCPKCEKVLRSKKSLMTHTRVIHSEAGQIPVPCPHCGKEFKKLNLRTHIYTVHRPKGHQCSQCDFKAQTHYNLKVHVSKVHLGKKELDKEECDLCGITTTNLSYHKKTHH